MVEHPPASQDKPDALITQVPVFIDSLAAEKGYADNTLRAYRHDLVEFCRYAAGQYATGQERGGRRRAVACVAVDVLMIRGYLAWLHGRNTKRTIARKLSALRVFFAYLQKHGLVSDNPAAQVLTPKQAKPLPSYLTVDDMLRLLDNIPSGTLLESRNRAMFETLYSSGLRVSELAGLDPSDLEVQAGFVRVRGKGNKERLVPIGDRALAAIDRYRARLPEAAARADLEKGIETALFLNRYGRRLSTRSIRRILDQLSRQCGLPMPVAPHGVRHSFATHLLEDGYDIRTIQELMGHRDVATTMIYTHVLNRGGRGVKSPLDR